MSGFVAVIATDDRPVGPGDVDALAAAYEAVRGKATPWAVEQGSWLRAIKLETPGAETSGVERAPDGWSLHGGAAYADRPLVTAHVGTLEGQFALLRHRFGTAEATLLVDPFGMQAVYVARREGRVYASTSALALARHLRAKPDREALLVWLRSGLQLGASTHWEGIERLEPATQLLLGPGVDRSDVYWRPAIDPRVRGLDFDAAVDEVIEVASAAWSPLTGLPTAWADLTGGFDTRLMNLLLTRSGVAFETQTRETRRGQDLEIAARVAAAAGWPWRAFHMPSGWPDEFPGWVDKALGWSDGHLDALHLARNLRSHSEAATEHDALFVGIGGDHMRGHAWRQEMYLEGRSNRVNWDNLLDMRLLHPIDTRLFASDPTTAVRSELERRVKGRAEPYRDELNTVQLDAIHAFKMTAHAGAFCSADGGYLRAQLPFYHRAVFSTAFSVDHRHRNNHRLMRHMIQRLNPRVAAVETDTGGPAQAMRLRNVHRFAPYYARLGRKAVNKLSYRALGRELLPVSLPTGSTMTEAISRYLASIRLQPSTMRSAPLYASTPLRSFLADAGAGTFHDLDLLGRIATVELALRAVDGAVD